jgi:hypothetical protein
MRINVVEIKMRGKVYSFQATKDLPAGSFYTVSECREMIERAFMDAFAAGMEAQQKSGRLQ